MNVTFKSAALEIIDPHCNFLSKANQQFFAFAFGVMTEILHLVAQLYFYEIRLDFDGSARFL